MNSKHADMTVTVNLFPTEAGGRRGPTPSDKFHCVMVIDEMNFDVRIYLEGIGSICPGQTVSVPIKFLDWERARKTCSVGKKVFLREGRRIGDGVIDTITHNDDDEGKDVCS